MHLFMYVCTLYFCIAILSELSDRRYHGFLAYRLDFLRSCCHLVETLRNILSADVCILFLAYQLFDAYFVVYINR